MISIDIYTPLKDLAGYLKEKYNSDEELFEKFTLIRERVYKLHEENLKTREELEELKRKENLRDGLEFDDLSGIYTNNDKSEYYCPACLDGNNKKCRLHRYRGESNHYYFSCSVCSTTYREK